MPVGPDFGEVLQMVLRDRLGPAGADALAEREVRAVAVMRGCKDLTGVAADAEVERRLVGAGDFEGCRVGGEGELEDRLLLLACWDVGKSGIVACQGRPTSSYKSCGRPKRSLQSASELVMMAKPLLAGRFDVAEVYRVV